MSSGYVYVLSNPAMPGLVKVGRSINGGHSRGKTMYQTGVPEQFVLEFELYCAEHETLETLAHEKLAQFRVNPGREFFKCCAAEAIEALLTIYVAEILGTGFYVVDEFAHSASADLMFHAHKHGLHWIDVFGAVPHLSEFAIRHAVDEYREACEVRRAKLKAKRESQ